MAICSNCGRAASESARYCAGCGQEMPAPPAAQEAAVCTSCGAPMLPAAKFCGSCGTASASLTATVRRPANTVRLAAGATTFAVAAAVVIAALFFWRSGGSDNPGLVFARVGPVDKALVADIDKAFSKIPGPAGATDRDQVRDIMGTPDAFEISFERTGKSGDGPAVRYETWFYYEILSAFEFADGKLISNLPIDEVSAPTLLPRRYDPAAFKRSMRWEDTKALLHDPSTFESRQLPREFDVPLVFYAGEQLLLGFDDEGLVYVETIPLTLGGGQ